MLNQLMNRSQLFLVVSLVLLLGGGILFYYLSKPLRRDNSVKAISLEKEQAFRDEVVVLDSLYKEYANAVTTNNQSALANASARLDQKISGIRKRYAGTTSPPALLASKLVRNYEFRILLTQKLLERRQLQSGEVNRLTLRIKELEAANLDLKTKNQMVEQAILNLP